MIPVLPENPCRDLKMLSPRFYPGVVELMARMKKQEFDLRVAYTIRNPWEQAVIWRRSRTREEIAAAIEKLKIGKAYWLAEVLDCVGPQSGPWATNALPGLSPHNWAEAVDLFLVEHGKMVKDGNAPGYMRLALAVGQLGLTSRRAMGDAGHVQLMEHDPPHYMALNEIDARMQELYGGNKE